MHTKWLQSGVDPKLIWSWCQESNAYVRLAAVLNFENIVITIVLETQPTNRESRMEDLSSKK